MCFKRAIRLGLAASLFLTTACGLNTGENPPAVQKPSFSGNGYSCVGQIPTEIDLYFNDKLSEDQISSFMICLQKTFVTFAQYTRGSESNTYSPDEIRNFLQEHFFRDRKISDELLREFMIIKQAMLGGSLTAITRKELLSTVEFFEDIRREAIRMKPHMQVLNPRLADLQRPSDLGERLAAANNALRQTIQTFVTRLGRSRQTYSYASLDKFLTEFRTFIGWDKYYTGESSRDVAHWVRLLKEFKELTVSEVEPDGVRTNEWTPLLENMSRWYLAYLQYRVGVKDQPILEGVGLQNTIFLADELFRLTEQALESHRPSRTITYAKISQLYEALYNLGWVQKKIRPEGLQRALEAAFTRVFGDPRAATQNRRVSGLKIATLNSMRAEFNRWADIQVKLDATYRRRADTTNVPSIQTAVPGGANILARLADISDSDFEEFNRIKTQNLMRPLYTEIWKLGDPYLVSIVPDRPVDFGVAGLRNQFYNLSRMNFLRSIVTLIFRGYSAQGSRADWTSQITKTEMESFYQDFREIGVDVGFVDPRNERVGERAFMEGNLFTYASDHFHKNVKDHPELDGQLSFTEGMALGAFMYSGAQIANRIYADLKTTCSGGSKDVLEQYPLDLLLQPMLPRCCVYKNLAGELERELVNMPGLQAFVSRLSPEDRMSYIEDVLGAVYSSTNSNPRWVEQNELTTLSVILHYAEAVMTRYDTDHDGVLTTTEIVDKDTGVLTVFAGHLMVAVNEMRTREAAEYNRTHPPAVSRIRGPRGGAYKAQAKTPSLINESDAGKAFMYIVKYKEVPDTEQWGDWWYLVAKMTVSNPTISVSRRELAQIFKVFGNLLSPPPPLAQNGTAQTPNVPLPPGSCQK